MCRGNTNPAPLLRLAARILWRVEREGTGLTEGCLVAVDELQNHVEHFGEEEQKELRVDVDTFLQYWPPQSQQFSMQYISHVFGVVGCLVTWPGRGRGGRNLGLVSQDLFRGCQAGEAENGTGGDRGLK